MLRKIVLLSMVCCALVNASEKSESHRRWDEACSASVLCEVGFTDEDATILRNADVKKIHVVSISKGEATGILPSRVRFVARDNCDKVSIVSPISWMVAHVPAKKNLAWAMIVKEIK